MREGPSLEAMMDRLAAIPPEFSARRVKSAEGKGGIKLSALVNDLVADMGGRYLSHEEITFFDADPEKKPSLKIAAILCHIFHDPLLIRLDPSHRKIVEFLSSKKLNDLASSVEDTGTFITDPERREELCRLALAAVGLFPAGENEKLAVERLATLDSVERNIILEKSMLARQRAREIREAMLRKEAEEAASKMSRE